MAMKWAFTITANDTNELIEELRAASMYVQMFPAMFKNSEVDALFQLTDATDAARIE